MKVTEISEPKFARFLFADTRVALLWLIVRFYVGYEWFMAGWGKLSSPSWTGESAGSAIKGFLSGALAKTAGEHPDVSFWYGYFIQNFAMVHPAALSYLVVYGEIAVGAALILGLFTGIAAFFGIFMNFNYLFAGTVSVNPTLLLLEIFLILAWRVAGYWGLDRYALKALGTPWQAGEMFARG